MAVNPVLQRMQLLTGAPALKRLGECRVAIFGIGGVGSWAAEALARSGVGRLTLVDNDVVCVTNVNRQLQATVRNVGRPKVDELKARLAEVNPRCRVDAVQKVYEPSCGDEFGLGGYDYVLDCIDSISCKVDLILRTKAAGTTLFASMGAAGKLDPTRIRVASIWETDGCPLARLIRRRLRRAGFDDDLRVVFSPEAMAPVDTTSAACGTHVCHCPESASDDDGERRDCCAAKKVINGSAVHMTATFGMYLAGLVIGDVVAAHPASGDASCDLT
jgi:tRNA A37 threonylcarbamoyladenosine dehydratase